MKLWSLINPSVPYTFRAADIKIAGAVACIISPGFGAKNVDDENESTPLFYGYIDWLNENGIDSDFLVRHAAEFAEAFDSFLIGDPSDRTTIEMLLNEIEDPVRRKAARDKIQDKNRTSMNRIGKAAHEYADLYRNLAGEQQESASVTQETIP